VTLGLIWAQAANGVLGSDGSLPWHLPEDLARFRDLTMGCTVVMGRRTWESLPAPVRPLPGRRNVVLTRSPEWVADGAVVARSLDEALDHRGDLWVIGGASVYREALSRADVVELTELEQPFAGDVTAPEIGADWEMAAREPVSGWATSRTGLRYRTSRWVRRNQPFAV
jgi:dihydrofolate reductase